MTPDTYLEKHLNTVAEALNSYAVLMQERAMEFYLASQVSDDPETARKISDAFSEMAEETRVASRDLSQMARFEGDTRVLRKRS